MELTHLNLAWKIVLLFLTIMVGMKKSHKNSHDSWYLNTKMDKSINELEQGSLSLLYTFITELSSWLKFDWIEWIEDLGVLRLLMKPDLKNWLLVETDMDLMDAFKINISYLEKFRSVWLTFVEVESELLENGLNADLLPSSDTNVLIDTFSSWSDW